MDKLKIIREDTLHETIIKFMEENEVKVGEYDNMKSMVLDMISKGHMFNMERDRLRDAMEDITFMINPNDDVNKDRVSRGLEYDDDSEEEEDIDLMSGLQEVGKLMGSMGSMGSMGGMNDIGGNVDQSSGGSQ